MLPPPTLRLFFATAAIDLVEGQAVLDQPVRVDANLVLLLEAAPAIDLGGARDGAQLGLDDPVVNGAQIGQVVALAGDDIVKDLAQAGGDRSHLGPFHAGRQLDGGQPLVDQLAGEVDVGAVVEGDDHLRQAELRDRAELLQTGQPADGLLDREGDLPLDLLRARGPARPC